jgi:hypothetical protein
VSSVTSASTNEKYFGQPPARAWLARIVDGFLEWLQVEEYW